MKIITMVSTLLLAGVGLYGEVSASPNEDGVLREYEMSNQDYESTVVLLFIFPDLNEAVSEQELVSLELEKVLSRTNVHGAIEKLIPAGISVSEDLLNQAQRGLKVVYDRANDLMKISVRSANKLFSRDLANSLAERYVESRKTKKGDLEVRIHQKADIGVLIETKNPQAEQSGAAQPATAPE